MEEQEAGANPNNMEPDSLMMINSTEMLTEDEIVQAFENEDQEIEVADRATSVDMSVSRASVDSQRSVSFFVDLNDDNLMAHSVMATPRPTSGRRTRSQQGERLTQSMYVRSDSQSSGVSFFVDISDDRAGHQRPTSKNKKMVHSMSREEADHDLDELSEDMRVKSRLLLAQNLEQTKAFFGKLKNYVDFLSMPSYSKDELRQKRKMAENISRLMFEEEQKLKKGQSLSSMAELDKILLGGGGGGGASLNTRQTTSGSGGQKALVRPVSAYCSSSMLQPGGSSSGGLAAFDNNDKPVLRRERTFDLDPKPNQKTKLVEVNIDIDTQHNDDNDADSESVADGQTLQMFQQQRLYHTMRLKREIAKLEKMERDIAQKASEIGPDQQHSITQTSTPTSTPRSKQGVRQCWNSEPKTKTSFKDIHEQRRARRFNDSQDSTSSWFIPDESIRPNTSSGVPSNRSRGSQTNHSLFRQYYEKKDKAVCVRDRPQAFFIECNGRARPKSAIEQTSSQQSQRRNSKELTNIIDLETETLPEEKNLQEALRRKRPDYIEKTRTREQDRLAKSFVQANKQASLSARSTPIKSVTQAKAIYGNSNGMRSRIPQISSNLTAVKKKNGAPGSAGSSSSSNGSGNVSNNKNGSNAKKISMTAAAAAHRNSAQPLKAVH